MLAVWLGPAVFAVAFDAKAQAEAAPSSGTAPAAAAPGPPPDRSTPPEPAPDQGAADAKTNPFYLSELDWVHSFSSETLGVGAGYQSSDPKYEMSLSLLPRWRFAGTEDDGFYTAGQVDVVREMTNSDVTTNRGETTLSDTMVMVGYERLLHKQGDYETVLLLRAPVLTLPTSHFSYANGTYLGLGVAPRLVQKLPLAGSGASVFRTVTFRAHVEYPHTLTRAETPTNPELHRVRLDPDGRTVSGDQLTGAAFPEHEVRFDVRTWLDLAEGLDWYFDFSYRPVWKYRFSGVDVCITTGCERLGSPPDPQRYIVVTAFESELRYTFIDELSLGLAYANVQTQPGVDGQRRNLFYAPGAQIAIKLEAHLDALYADAMR